MATLRSVIEEVLKEQGVVHPTDGTVSHWSRHEGPCEFRRCLVPDDCVSGEDKDPRILVEALTTVVSKHVTCMIEEAIQRHGDH